MFQKGEFAATACPAGQLTQFEVIFPTPFATPPFVSITLQSGSDAAGMGNLFVGINGNPTATGFKINVWNNDVSSRTPKLRWIAISA